MKTAFDEQQIQQIPLPLHLQTNVENNRTNVPLSTAESRMILSLENNVNVVSNIIRDSDNLIKIKCSQCRKVNFFLFCYKKIFSFIFSFLFLLMCGEEEEFTLKKCVCDFDPLII